jgi:flagellar export protein FliJ
MTRKQTTVTKALKLKGFTREQLKSEVKKALGAFDHEKEKLDCLEEELRVHLDEFSRKQCSGTIGVREMDLFYMYFGHLSKLIEQQKKCVRVRQLELDEKQREMHEVHKEHRLMEILRDRIIHSELRETVHSDQKEADYQFLARRVLR